MQNVKNTPQVRFHGPKSMGPRNWGTEDMVAMMPTAPDGAAVKVMRMRAGTEGNLQKHNKKFEISHLLDGQMEFTYVDPSGALQKKMLSAGDTVVIPVGAIHREHAITDCIVIELGSPHANDRVAMNESFGLSLKPNALPSTTADEVVTLSERLA